jgi:spore coat protein A
MHPGEITSVVMKFDLTGGLPFDVPSTPRARAMGLTDRTKTYHEYVWHCHILEHEEHDMMRPLVVQS